MDQFQGVQLQQDGVSAGLGKKEGCCSPVGINMQTGPGDKGKHHRPGLPQLSWGRYPSFQHVYWGRSTGPLSPMLSTENRQQGKWTVSFSGSGLLDPLLLVMNGQQSRVDPELTHRERGSNIPFQEAPCPLSPTPEPTSTCPSSRSFYTVLSLDHWTANWETVCWVERIFLYFIVGFNLRLHLL